MLPEEVVEAVADTVSGLHAVDYVRDLTRFHRIQASPGFHDAVEYLKNEITRVSRAELKVFEYPATGQGSIETWEEIYGWFPKSAKLELTEPERRTLANFEVEPISLVAQSCAADVEAEVVYIGKGLKPSDFENRDVAGKIVLAEGRASYVHRNACIQRNAAGVLIYTAPSGSDEIGNLRPYSAIWPRPGEASKTRFGFALTQSDAVRIKKWLDEGKRVKVSAKVDAKLGTGKIEIVSALIRGKEASEEVWFVAHICHPHPSANDNASGAAVLLESLRVISKLIAEGVVPEPSRSIRFLWLPEWSGTIKLVHNEKDLTSRCKAMVNVDMVGADPAKSGSLLHLYRTPYSLPTTLNNLIRYWLNSEVSRKPKHPLGGTACPIKWSYDVYSAGSDHLFFVDATLGIPAVMINQFPDRFYHTSTDTPDKIDPVQMEFVTRTVILSALSLGLPQRVMRELILTAARNEAVELLHRVGEKAVTDLSACIDNPETLYPRYLKWLGLAHELGQATLNAASEEWLLIEEQEALRQALKAGLEMTYAAEMIVARRAYEGACAEAGLEAKEEEHFQIDKESLDLEVKRRVRYALDPSHLAKSSNEMLIKYMDIKELDTQISERIDEILNLSVEWRPLTDIWNRLCMQFGPMDQKSLLRIIEDLRKVGLVETREV